MPRIPHAAKTLAEQVRKHYGRNADSKAGLETATPVGDPDGLGVYRSIQFDKTSSKWLGPVLAELDDPRIEEVTEEKGQVTVRFSHRTLADERHPFPLDDAATVAGDSGDDA